MADTIVITITTNARKVARAFAKAPNELKKRIGVAISKSAFLIERESKVVAPKDTGHMSRSISTSIKPLSAIIGPHVNYAIFVHEGTRFMKARPFMEWGIDSSLARIEGFVNKAVDETLVMIERTK